jgi:hypothetical protein
MPGRRHHSHFLALALSLAGCTALVSACGPATPEPNVATGDGATAGGGGSATDGGSEAATTGGDTKEGVSSAVAPAESIPIGTTSMAADFAKIGIDLKKPPKLETIKLMTKKKMMPFFQKSLGLEECTGCHAEGDYKKNTRMVQIARNMWNQFVVDMRDEKGGPLLCDNCHQGKQKLLARGDKEALAKFMEANYEKKLTLVSGDDNGCTTCHGSEMEMDIFGKLWNVK